MFKGLKLSNMNGIICLDCAINIHFALNKWRLLDEDGTVGVKNLTGDFKNICRGTPGSSEKNSEIERLLLNKSCNTEFNADADLVTPLCVLHVQSV